MSERYVDVSHEALIRGWPRLRGWLDEDRAGLRLHRRISEAAEEWHRSNRDNDLLYRGARLVQAQEWRERNELEFNPVEREFMDASMALKQRLEQQEKERQQRELDTARKLAETERQRADVESRARRRQRFFTIGLGGLLLLVGVIAVLAVSERHVAVSERQNAIVQQRKAEEQLHLAVARQLETFARQALDEKGDVVLSVLLSVESLKNAWTVEGHTIWGRGMDLLSHRPEKTWGSPGLPTLAVAFSGDGRWLASVNSDASVTVLDTVTEKAVLPLSKQEGQGISHAGMAFSPDGKWLVTGAAGEARVWDTQNWKVVERLPHGEMVWAVAFSPDNHLLATESYHSDQTQLYDTKNWDKPLPPIQTGDVVWALSFSNDSRT